MLTDELPVVDPFDVRADSGLPDMHGALDPAAAGRRIGALLRGDTPSLQSIRVVRHKPGRRCLIEYAFETEDRRETVLGKVRARGLDQRSFETQAACWKAGVPVPEPLGMVPDFQMWVQRRVRGVDFTSQILERCTESDSVKDVADLVFKLHQAGIPTWTTHDINDELTILHTRLGSLSMERPAWAGRIARVLLGAERIGASLRPGKTCGIHRDFYPDQVIVDGERSWLVDLDLYCQGDAGLDIGNFAAHLIELGLRLDGDPDMFREIRQAFERRYIELAGERVRDAIDVYTTLTLVRHIQISTLFPERTHTTSLLLDLCENRMRHVISR